MKKLTNLLSFALIITFTTATVVANAATLPEGTETFVRPGIFPAK